jgi:hypothetical protein
VRTYGSTTCGSFARRGTPLGLDGTILVNSTPIGDGLLNLVDRWGEVPISPGWTLPMSDYIDHDTGREWKRIRLYELAICAKSLLPWGRVQRWAA